MHAVAAVERDDLGGRVDGRDGARDHDLGAHAAGLLQRAARQLVARHAGGKAQVVLDA
jgi:hypothetical protein